MEEKKDARLDDDRLDLLARLFLNHFTSKIENEKDEGKKKIYKSLLSAYEKKEQS